MKGFIITSILFSLLLLTIIFNAAFLKSSIQDMKNTVELLTPIPCKDNNEIIDQLIQKWEQKSIWFSLSVSYEDVEELTDMIDSLKATNETQNIEQFTIHTELLLNTLDEIIRLERFSIDNIL